VVPDDVAAFGDRVVDVLRSVLDDELVGAWFVGSIALGGYVPGESDIDIKGVCERRVPDDARHVVAAAIVGITAECPTRGLEFTLYRREIAASQPSDAAFEVNANGGPRMDTVVRVTPEGQPGFWYAIDRAIAHRHGVTIAGPPAASIFADASRMQLLAAMRDSMQWHRAHERATLYSVLNAARAWRFAEDDVLGSKLEGATWARGRWHDPALIDAAVDLRHGRPASLDEGDVDALLDHVEGVLTNQSA